MVVLKLLQPSQPADPPFWKSTVQDDLNVVVAVHLMALETLENPAYFDVQRHIGQVGQWADHQGLESVERMTPSWQGSALGQILTV